MADPGPRNGADAVTPEALQAAAGRLRHVDVPDRGGDATASRSPLVAELERAMDRMGPIPRNDDVARDDSEWDDGPADTPSPRAAAQREPSPVGETLQQGIAARRAPTAGDGNPGAGEPAAAQVAQNGAPSPALNDVLAERLASRRAAIAGDDEHEAEGWGRPDAADVSFEVKEALARSQDVELDELEASTLQQEVKASLAQQAAALDAPSAVPPSPPQRDAVPSPPSAGMPPLPPRPGEAPAKLPLLSEEQNKMYAAQVEHQRAAMSGVNTFLGTPAGQNVDRVTAAMGGEAVSQRGAIQNVPSQLAHLEAQKLPPDRQRAEVEKLLGKAADYDQKLGRLEGRVDRIAAGRDPGPDLPLSSRAEYEAFANRSERMHDLLVQADRAMDPKAPVQLDEATQKQAVQMLRLHPYLRDVPRQLKDIENMNLDPAVRNAAVTNVMASMPEIDKRMDGMDQSLKDLSVAQLGDRAPKPLPGLTPDQQAEFADRSARMRGMLNHLDRMMDPKAPRQPDAALKTQTLELLNANRYMMNLPSELKDIDKQNLDPAAKQAQVDKLMAPMAVVDKRMDATAKSINDFYVGKDRPPAQLTGVTPEQSKEYALRSRRMDAMLENLDRMNDSKLPIQPGKTMQRETLELLRANAHLKELPKQLERLDAQNLDPAAKQAQVDKLMAPMGEIDQRMTQMDRRMVGHAADLDAAEKRGTLGRFIDRVKDYGSRAVDAVKSIPDRISERFSSATDPQGTPPQGTPVQGMPAQAMPPQAPRVAPPSVPSHAAAQGVPVAAVPGPPVPPSRSDMPPPVPPRNDSLGTPPPVPPRSGMPPPVPPRNDSLGTPPAVPPRSDSLQAPAAHLTVKMGPDEQHELPKGVGFQTGGVVESVDHKDGQMTVHYKLGSHPEVLSVDEKSPLGGAVDHLKPGDQFDVKISRDATKHEVAQLEDKTDHFKAVVHDTGVVEKGVAPSTPAPDRSRGH